MNDNPIPRIGAFLTLGFVAAVFVAGLGVVLLAALIGGGSSAAVCSARGGGGALSVTLGPPGMRRTVGASEYGGPDDPSSGTVGASGANLLTAPDSYAELGGDSFQTAVALGGSRTGRRCASPGTGARRSPTSAISDSAAARSTDIPG